MLIAIVSILLLSVYLLIKRGLRYVLCLIPGMFLFVGLELYVSDMLTPSSYPGDFFDMFLPLITVPAHIVLALFSLGLALLITRTILWLAYKNSPPAAIPTRIVVLVLLAATGISLAVELALPRIERHEQRQNEKRVIESANSTISSYFNEKMNKKDFLDTIEKLSREATCSQSFASDIENILLQGDRSKAAAVLYALERSCFDSPTVEDMIRDRLQNGTIRDLNTLLAIGVTTNSRALDKMAKYALINQNDDDFLALLTHFLDTPEGKTPSPASSSGLRTLMVLAAEGGSSKKEVLNTFFANAGRDPLRYLLPDDFATISYAFLSIAANRLEPDLLKFYIDMGFTKERSLYGSVLFSFISTHGGPVLIQRLIDAGAEVNAVSTNGFTPLLSLLWRPEASGTPYDTLEEQKALATFNLLFALNNHRLYVTPNGENMLHRACAAGRYSPQGIAEITVLLKAGADPALAGSGLAAPIDVATKYGWNQARDLLVKAQERQKMPDRKK